MLISETTLKRKIIIKCKSGVKNKQAKTFTPEELQLLIKLLDKPKKEV